MHYGYTARATWALEVPPGDIFVLADSNVDFPASIKISIAAIDPTEEAVIEEGQTAPRIPRSTLKLVRFPSIVDDSDSENNLKDLIKEQLEDLKALAAAEGSDSEDGSEKEPEAGPSNSSKPKDGVKKLTNALKDTADSSDEEMADVDAVKPNGVKRHKGKSKALTEDDEEDDSDAADSDSDDEPNVTVICTLDTERNYQQPLDIILPSYENVGFIVSGTHSIHLTGNLVTHYKENERDDDEELDEDDYDMEPDSDELIENDSDEESDVLDGQSITEVSTDEDEEEVPKLIPAATKKTAKKRPAEEEAGGLDMMISAEEKQGKNQRKKVKNNQGQAVPAKEAEKKEATNANAEPTQDSKSDKADKTDKNDKAEKKVQFAKNLEQGPTGSNASNADDKKATPAITVVKGVKIDDRKVCEGRKAKTGDKVSMRYIGKLENGTVFDANKKGPPFTFKLGKGEVIKGWDVGVVGMAAMGERRLTVPPSMAYGKRAMGKIPANSTLIFDLKLLDIK